jgi:hypothetical protein
MECGGGSCSVEEASRAEEYDSVAVDAEWAVTPGGLTSD